ncbi:MAG TPA: CBS domain-containing protein [Pyrinomonadaceae bacterium]|jgi:CBS domain-containing protein|nr:CBS domain-containing protein [Pyrinomonadaceae bacterium]
MITIRHVVCDREPYFVPDTATALDAADYMAGRNIGAVCVLDREEKLCGIFSERDLLKRVVVRKLDPSGVAIRDVMSEPRAVIDCGDTPREALERMERVGSRHLPVVDGDRFVGMLSIRDIMRVEMSEQGAELQLLHEYISH